MRLNFRVPVAATAAVLALVVPVAAQAASITYIGPDHNVHLASPDGAVRKQVTTNGSASLRYEVPSQADDGTIVAVGEGTTANDGSKFAHFLRPDGTQIETQPLPVPSGLVRIPALTGGQVAPHGGQYLYDWAQSPFSGGTKYATSLIGRTQSMDACGVRCKYDVVSPRWVGNTGVSLVIDAYLGTDGVAVQPNSAADPAPWFNFTEAAISSVDESARRLAVEAVPSSTATILDVLTDEPATTLVMLRYTGAPGSALPVLDCELENYTEIPGYARLSPDGSMLAWQDREGVYVSPVPSQTGGATCTLQPRLIAPGGSRPDWGPADVPPPAAVAPQPPVQQSPAPQPPAVDRPAAVTVAPRSAQSAACTKAKRAVTAAKKRVAKAKKSLSKTTTSLRKAKKARSGKRIRAARRSVARARASLKRAERHLTTSRRLAARRC